MNAALFAVSLVLAPARAALPRVAVRPVLTPAPSAPLPALTATARFVAPSDVSLSAPALAPSLLAAPAVAPDAQPLLIETLSAPFAEDRAAAPSESSAAAETDFMARAQLGGARQHAPAVAFSAPSARPAPSGLLPSAPAAPARARILPFAGVDHSGDVMRAALAALRSRPEGESMKLDFAPSPKSLRVMSELDHEVFLYRAISDGSWRLARGDSHGVSGEWEDYDLAIHNHPETRLGAYTVNSDMPSPQDLETSRGKDARMLVVSRSGVVEWNSDLPEGIAAKLQSTRLGRVVMRLTFPSFYPWLLARTGVALESTSWKKFDQAKLDSGARPVNERILMETLIPRWVAEELPVVAARMGRPLDEAHTADVLRRTNAYRMYWHSSWSYKDHPDHRGIPDGHFREDFGIRLMVKPDWRKLKDLETHFKVLFAHEYTHWLQNEGRVTARGDAEGEAVAVETLRAIELVGFPGVVAGLTGTIHEGGLSAIAAGREWARGSMRDETPLYWRGTLGGVAYQVGQDAGRPEAAWEYLRLVTDKREPLTHADARAKMLGR